MTGPALPAVPAFDHIFLIIMENHSASQIIGSADAPGTGWERGRSGGSWPPPTSEPGHPPQFVAAPLDI